MNNAGRMTATARRDTGDGRRAQWQEKANEGVISSGTAPRCSRNRRWCKRAVCGRPTRPGHRCSPGLCNFHTGSQCTGRLASTVWSSICLDGIYASLPDSGVPDSGVPRLRGLLAARSLHLVTSSMCKQQTDRTVPSTTVSRFPMLAGQHDEPR